ncbi:hypothetical protein AAIG33_07530 [Phytobacter ursingii]|uniref:hypothetical protein n=1 Tax=Phytobacter ursingii TaxID=1972431 RepID=UPI00117BDD69
MLSARNVSSPTTAGKIGQRGSQALPVRSPAKHSAAGKQNALSKIIRVISGKRRHYCHNTFSRRAINVAVSRQPCSRITVVHAA